MDPNMEYAVDMQMQQGAAVASGVMLLVFAVNLISTVLIIIGFWKIFSKAGQPCWASIIPIYNVVVAIQVAGRPIWWIALILLVPVANVVCGIILLFDIAGKFGKGAGFGFGMLFLLPIFSLILGFGSAEYEGGGEEEAVPA